MCYRLLHSIDSGRSALGNSPNLVIGSASGKEDEATAVLRQAPGFWGVSGEAIGLTRGGARGQAGTSSPPSP